MPLLDGLWPDRLYSFFLSPIPLSRLVPSKLVRLGLRFPEPSSKAFSSAVIMVLILVFLFARSFYGTLDFRYSCSILVLSFCGSGSSPPC